jgi:hypothetical protein
MVCPPALSVACTPFAKVGHDPLATGRSGGAIPPSVAEPPLPEPLEEPLLDPLDPPLLDPELLDDPLEPPEEPELLEALPASAPPPFEPPLPPPELPPLALSVDDDPLQPAASAIPSTPRPRRLLMAAKLSARRRPAQRQAERETLEIRGDSRNFPADGAGHWQGPHRIA